LYKAAATCNYEALDCLFGFTYDSGRFYLNAWDLNMTLYTCVSRMNLVAWNNVIRAFQDKHPNSFEERESARSEETGTSHGFLDETIIIPGDGQDLLVECWTTYEKARGRHLLRIPCQRVDGLFELSTVTFQDKIESLPSPVLLIQAGEPKTTKKLSEAAAALLEQASEDPLLKYGFGT
jgi:hypothetical protein